MKRTALKRRSAKGQRYEDEYLEAAKVVLERAGGRCEIQAAHDCDGEATPYPHHRRLRSQGGDNSVDNLLAVCWSGHDWIHRVLPREEAERLGLILPRERPDRAYVGWKRAQGSGPFYNPLNR